MREILEKLAFKWCEDYGDKEHKRFHTTWDNYREKFNPFCGNCNDGFHYAEDVLKAIIKRIS